MDAAASVDSRFVQIANRSCVAHVVSAPAPGKGHDRWLVADGILAVADGATPLRSGSMDPGALAEEILKSLAGARANSARGRLSLALASAVGEAQVGDASAGLAAILDAPAGPAAVVLGDCDVFVVAADRVIPITGRRLAALDARVLRRLRNELRSGETLASARDRVHGALLANRQLRNRPGGYWVVGGGPHVEAHALIRRLPADFDGIVIASDGFARLWNVFKIATPLDLVRSRGENLPHLLAELRGLESSRADSPIVAQFADSDDATAIVVIPVPSIAES